MSPSNSDDSPMDHTPQPPRGAISKRQCNKRTAIFQINDPYGNPAYVLRSCRGASRKASLQSDVMRQCPRIAAKLPEWCALPGYSFTANCHPIKGVRHGVPMKEGDKYKHYFVSRLNGKGTLHHTLNPDGCNQREANNALKYDEFIPEIEEKLKQLGDDEDIFPPLATFQHEREMAENTCNILGQIVDELRATGSGIVPEDVNECFTLSESLRDSMQNVEETRKAVNELLNENKKDFLAKKGKRVTDALITSEIILLCKRINEIKSLVGNFVPSESNPSQGFSHNILSKGIVQTTVHLGNGEECKIEQMKELTYEQVFHMLSVIDKLLLSRELAGAPSKDTFKAYKAWLKPGCDLKWNLDEQLVHCKEYMKLRLSDCQIYQLRVLLQEIKAAIAHRDAAKASTTGETFEEAPSSPHTERGEHTQPAHSGRMSPASMEGF